MLSPSKFTEIKNRAESNHGFSTDIFAEDRALLVAEVERLTKFVKNFSDQVTEKLDAIESDRVRLEEESQRLRKIGRSADIERDACVGLIAKMAIKLGIQVGIGK